MKLTQDILTYIEGHQAQALELLLALAPIPAPSNEEGARAAFCRDWLMARGCRGVYLDEVGNVVWPIGCEGDGPITVYMAHSDVVFPDRTPLPLRVEGKRVFCPGIGDDTANAVALMSVMAYLAEHPMPPKDGGVLLVINVGEEGLGNLRGSRAVMEKYGQRVREFITFDGYAEGISDRAVGSTRYRVEIDTEGGHSWGNFGNRNAIAAMASLIERLYALPIPTEGRTTFNVGTISGGTSVNTIAQHAEMLYEFRSDRVENLAQMETQFHETLKALCAEGCAVTVTVLGQRPCGIEVDATAHGALVERATRAIETHYGMTPKYHAGSTDCNVPLSMGIPAVCLSCVRGGGAHTREEYIEVDSLLPGLRVAYAMILHHF